jgi:hypothetical protein
VAGWRGTRSRAVRGQLGKLEIKVVNSRYRPIRRCLLDAVDRPRVLGDNPTGRSMHSRLVWCFQLPKRHVKRSTSPPTHCAPGLQNNPTKQVCHTGVNALSTSCPSTFPRACHTIVPKCVVMLLCIAVIIICSTYFCVIVDFNMLVTNK